MVKKLAIILSSTPYEKRTTFTGARIALQAQMEDMEATVILMEDGVYCGKKGQESTQFFKTVELLGNFLEIGGKIIVCGMCLIERGLTIDDMIDGCTTTDLSKLIQTIGAADQTIFF